MENGKLTIDELESLRKNVIARIIISVCISVAAAIGLMILFSSSGFFDDVFVIAVFFPIITGGIIFALIFLLLCHSPIKRFKTAFKLSVVSSALGEVFTDVDYDPAGYFPKDLIKNSYMVATGNRYSGDDLIRAKYKNIPFSCCDLLIQNHTSNGKSSSTVTYFKGKWFIFDFPKFKDLYLRIVEKRGGATKAGTFFSDLKAEKIAFENERFNREFEVRSSDRHMAFYIVTPVFMEDLQKLNDIANGQLIVGVKDGRLHVAVHTNRNSLEPGIFTPVTGDSARGIKDEMKTITAFIDNLIENKKLFGENERKEQIK